jgi:hypothetical protein
MSAVSQRADRAEERAAKALGVARLGGKRKKERVPDTMPVRLSDGRLLQPEVKSRAHLPKALTKALDQAKRYAPTSEPIAVFFAKGERRGVVVLDLDLFTSLVGIRDSEGERQLNLLLTAAR